MFQSHPLDQLIKDDSLLLLEAMIPFVDYAYKKPLILLIKYREMQEILRCFDDPSFIASRGFDCHPANSEEMMECMCRFLPGDFAGNIKNMQQMLKMMQVMQVMNEPGSPCGPPPDRDFDYGKPDGPPPDRDINYGKPDGPPPDYHASPKKHKDLYSSVMDILNS